MEHHSIERHVLILFSRKLFPASFDKEGWNFVFFWNRFDIHHCQVRFSTSTFFEPICRILRLFSHLHGQGRSWPGLKFLAAELFCRRVFGKNNWKPTFPEQVLLCCLRFLQRASVTLLPFFGLLSHIWHPKAGKAMKHKLQLVFSRTFCFFFTRFWPKIIVQKMIFLKNSASSKVLRVRYAWKWSISNELRNRLNNMYSSEFWFKCELRANFAHGWIAEKCQKLFP